MLWLRLEVGKVKILKNIILMWARVSKWLMAIIKLIAAIKLRIVLISGKNYQVMAAKAVKMRQGKCSILCYIIPLYIIIDVVLKKMTGSG